MLERVLALVLASVVAAIVVVVASSHASRPVAATSPGPPVASTPGTPAGSPFDGPTMPPGLRAANFRLRDVSGRWVDLSQFHGQVVVLTFIHSLCHDACPLMVEQIKGALNDLPAAGRGVTAIGISVAPGEDTVAHRRRFLARHEMLGRMFFLNGPLPVMRVVWHDYAMQPVTPKIDHSTFVLLIDKRGGERVGFPVDQLTPEGLAHDIRVLEREPA